MWDAKVALKTSRSKHLLAKTVESLLSGQTDLTSNGARDHPRKVGSS